MHNFNMAFEEKKIKNYCVTLLISKNVSLWLVTNSDLCGNFLLSFFVRNVMLTANVKFS